MARIEAVAGLLAGALIGAALAAVLVPEEERTADRIRALANTPAPNL